jgi:hypothetical protein
MIWDLVNGLIQGTLSIVHSFFAILPQSPIYIPTATQTALAPLMGTAAWWFPVTGILTFLGLYVVALGLLIAVLLIRQFIEAVIP